MRLGVVAAALSALSFQGASADARGTALPEGGVAILTVTAVDGVGLSFDIRRLDARGGTTVATIPERPFHKPDFVIEDIGPEVKAGLESRGRWVARIKASGDVVSVKLPAGRYVIEQLECSSISGDMSWQTHYEFSVETGKVTYLGEFLAMEVYRKGPFGLAMHACEVARRDSHERDFQFAKQRGFDVTGALLPLVTN